MRAMSTGTARPNLTGAVVLSLVLVAVVFALNTWLCAQSALLQMPFVFSNSDMNLYVKWAESIRDQGWLNPRPYHPYVHWMQAIGSYDEWLSWWGGGQIFQSAPLYPYLVAVSITLFDSLLPMHWAQCVFSIGVCAALGWVSYRLTRAPWAGLAGLLLAAGYGPFHAYAFPLLRDMLGWGLTAWVMLAAIEVDVHWGHLTRRRAWSVVLGTGLGLGFLARETFLVVIPAVVAARLWRGYRERDFRGLAALALPIVLAVSVVAYRNLQVGAPLLSTSNRYMENVVIGNAASTHPAVFRAPPEMRALVRAANGDMKKLFVDSVRTHPSLSSWAWLQARKVLSFFDPDEPCDNITLAFMGTISPMVRFGLPHWFIIVPGVLWLFLSLWRRDKQHAWLWALLPLISSSIFLTVAVSRYRQALVVFWLPWAVYALSIVVAHLKSRMPARAAVPALLCVSGWAACWLAPGVIDASAADRPTEYQIAIGIHEQLGETESADAMRALLRERFPGASESP